MKLFLPITICFFPLIGLCQEAVTDTIALPTLATTDVPKEVDLERVMSKIWELDREDQQGTFHLMEYQPMYIMPMRFPIYPLSNHEVSTQNAPYLSTAITSM